MDFNSHFWLSEIERGVIIRRFPYKKSRRFFEKSHPLATLKGYRNKAKAISAELLKLNLKNKWKKWGKQDETGRKGKTGRKNIKN